MSDRVVGLLYGDLRHLFLDELQIAAPAAPLSPFLDRFPNPLKT
jgi:hypothetical protein